MRDFLAGQPFTSPAYDVLMNVTARVETVPDNIKENLSLHLTQTVKWDYIPNTFLQCRTRPAEKPEKSFSICPR